MGGVRGGGSQETYSTLSTLIVDDSDGAQVLLNDNLDVARMEPHKKKVIYIYVYS